MYKNPGEVQPPCPPLQRRLCFQNRMDEFHYWKHTLGADLRSSDADEVLLEVASNLLSESNVSEECMLLLKLLAFETGRDCVVFLRTPRSENGLLSACSSRNRWINDRAVVGLDFKIISLRSGWIDPLGDIPTSQWLFAGSTFNCWCWSNSTLEHVFRWFPSKCMLVAADEVLVFLLSSLGPRLTVLFL